MRKTRKDVDAELEKTKSDLADIYRQITDEFDFSNRRLSNLAEAIQNTLSGSKNEAMYLKEYNQEFGRRMGLSKCLDILKPLIEEEL